MFGAKLPSAHWSPLDPIFDFDDLEPGAEANAVGEAAKVLLDPIFDFDDLELEAEAGEINEAAKAHDDLRSEQVNGINIQTLSDCSDSMDAASSKVEPEPRSLSGNSLCGLEDECAQKHGDQACDVSGPFGCVDDASTQAPMSVMGDHALLLDSGDLLKADEGAADFGSGSEALPQSPLDRRCGRHLISDSLIPTDTEVPGIDAEEPGFLKFPDGFLFGAATSAYQVEGAAAEGGRKPSIWDDFAAEPNRTHNGATGAVACDHYHRFRDDVAIMAHLGLKAYRFSISWSRLIPDGEGEINDEGARFYSDLIDALLEHGIEPWVTLYHWDLPSALEQRFGGWLDKKRVVAAFTEYATVCFRLFGDRVKRWMTINEPICVAALGYSVGIFAPGSSMMAATEPYSVAHNLLLAHASAVRVYRQQFAGKEGRIGIVLNTQVRVALDPSSQFDQEAAQRALDFEFGWFADPIFRGNYPKRMRETCGVRLPSFTPSEQQMLRGSSDFLGINFYFTTLVSSTPNLQLRIKGGRRRLSRGIGGFYGDMEVKTHRDPRAEISQFGWAVTPWGLRDVLLYAQRQYAPPHGLFVTENGCTWEPDISAQRDKLHGALMPRPYCSMYPPKEDFSGETFEDPDRVRFFKAHLTACHEAIAEGADVRGYFAWSLMDNFEWVSGYPKRFGIVRVDYNTQKRTIKSSGRFFAEVVEKHGLVALPNGEICRSSPQ